MISEKWKVTMSPEMLRAVIVSNTSFLSTELFTTSSDDA